MEFVSGPDEMVLKRLFSAEERSNRLKSETRARLIENKHTG